MELQLWDKKKCRSCGSIYFFGDGPTCKCRDEQDLWAEEWQAAFNDDLFGGNDEWN